VSGVDQFAGAGNPSGPSEIRVGGKTLDGRLDGCPDPQGRLGIVLRDELADCFKIVEHGLAPDDLHTPL
jgi:hypothetical protein